MEPVRIFSDPEDAEKRLEALGLHSRDLKRVIEQVVAARANVIALDAKAAGGSQAYLAAVRHLRLQLRSHGFLPRWRNGVEYCYNPKTGVSIFYQSVDSACRPKDPKPIHKKGPAASRIIGQSGLLFSLGQLPEFVSVGSGLNKLAYVLCVCSEEQRVSAELSCPTRVVNGRFEAFLERIFIVNEGDWSVPDVAQYVPPEDSLDISVTRK